MNWWAIVSRPYGTRGVLVDPRNPPMNWWAIVIRPYGTQRISSFPGTKAPPAATNPDQNTSLIPNWTQTE